MKPAKAKREDMTGENSGRFPEPRQRGREKAPGDQDSAVPEDTGTPSPAELAREVDELRTRLTEIEALIQHHFYAPSTPSDIDAAREREKIAEELAALGHSPTLKARNKRLRLLGRIEKRLDLQEKK
jgi:hypothetical protein